MFVIECWLVLGWVLVGLNRKRTVFLIGGWLTFGMPLLCFGNVFGICSAFFFFFTVWGVFGDDWWEQKPTKYQLKPAKNQQETWSVSAVVLLFSCVSLMLGWFCFVLVRTHFLNERSNSLRDGCTITGPTLSRPRLEKRMMAAACICLF